MRLIVTEANFMKNNSIALLQCSARRSWKQKRYGDELICWIYVVTIVDPDGVQRTIVLTLADLAST